MINEAFVYKPDSHELFELQARIQLDLGTEESLEEAIEKSKKSLELLDSLKVSNSFTRAKYLLTLVKSLLTRAQLGTYSGLFKL